MVVWCLGLDGRLKTRIGGGAAEGSARRVESMNHGVISNRPANVGSLVLGKALRQKKNPTKDLTLMVEKRGGWSAKLHITGLFDARRSAIHLDAPAAVQ